MKLSKTRIITGIITIISLVLLIMSIIFDIWFEYEFINKLMQTFSILFISSFAFGWLLDKVDKCET